MLQDARLHPEMHPDLVVRVSGYSSVFVRLGESIQDEIMTRTMVST
jgi:formate C-acetyltransferase